MLFVKTLSWQPYKTLRESICHSALRFGNHIWACQVLCFVALPCIVLIEIVPMSSLCILCASLQVDQLQIPTVKDMKHIDRKLKHCWDQSSHDEYDSHFLVQHVFCHNYNSSYLFLWFLCRHKKKEKKSKHKSKRTPTDAQL